MVQDNKGTRERKAAYHEAGHAVAAYANGVAPKCIRIRAEDGEGQCRCDFSATCAQTRSIIAIMGPLVERKRFCRYDEPKAQADIRDIAHYLSVEFIDDLAYKLDGQARRILQEPGPCPESNGHGQILPGAWCDAQDALKSSLSEDALLHAKNALLQLARDAHEAIQERPGFMDAVDALAEELLKQPEIDGKKEMDARQIQTVMQKGMPGG